MSNTSRQVDLETIATWHLEIIRTQLDLADFDRSSWTSVSDWDYLMIYERFYRNHYKLYFKATKYAPVYELLDFYNIKPDDRLGKLGGEDLC